MELSMLAAGWAMVSRRTLPALLGWLGLLTGALTVLTVFAPDTPLSTLAGAAFMPSLALAIAFRVWAGTALTRPEPTSQSVAGHVTDSARSTAS